MDGTRKQNFVNTIIFNILKIFSQLSGILKTDWEIGLKGLPPVLKVFVKHSIFHVKIIWMKKENFSKKFMKGDHISVRKAHWNNYQWSGQRERLSLLLFPPPPPPLTPPGCKVFVVP